MIKKRNGRATTKTVASGGRALVTIVDADRSNGVIHVVGGVKLPQM